MAIRFWRWIISIGNRLCIFCADVLKDSDRSSRRIACSLLCIPGEALPAGEAARQRWPGDAGQLILRPPLASTHLRRAAAGVALQAGAVAHQREVAAFGAGVALVAGHARGG